MILGTRGDIEVCGEAANGREAIDKAQELKPDLIILDITMPVLNGIDAAEILRKTMPYVPILFLSMHQGRQIIAEAKRIGVRGYVKSQTQPRPFARGGRSSTQRAVFPLRLFKNSASFDLPPSAVSLT